MTISPRFDAESRAFIKKVQAGLKFSEPPKLHKNLENPPVVLISESGIVFTNRLDLERQGWRRK